MIDPQHCSRRECGNPKPWQAAECSSLKLPSGPGDGEKKKWDGRDERPFSLQNWNYASDEITRLGGCDKIEEEIAGAVFRAAPGAYLPVPPSIRDGVRC